MSWDKIEISFLSILKFVVLAFALTLPTSCTDGTSSGTDTGNALNLRGRVLDKDGAGVQGVVARLSISGLADTTDDLGRYQISKDVAPISKSTMGALDTLIFLQGGGRVASLDIDKWVDSLPDLRLTQRGFSGQLSPTNLEIGKVEAVLSGTGISPDHPVIAEFFYNKPVNEYSGYIFFPTAGKEAQYSIYINVYDTNGFLIGRSAAVAFNGLAGNLTIPNFDPSGVGISAMIGGDTALGAGDTLKLDGTVSRTPPGTKIVEYAWKLPGDLGYKTDTIGSFKYVIPLPYDTSFVVFLRIKNDAGAQSQDSLKVRVISRIDQLFRHPIMKVAGPSKATTRNDPHVIVFKDRMWILGGSINGQLQNDVWSSADGINWSLATDSAPLSKLPATIVFKDTLWLIGDSAANAPIWYSLDGAKWTKSTIANSNLPPGHYATVYQDKIWFIGQNQYADSLVSSVWSSDDARNWKMVSTKTWHLVTSWGFGISSLFVFENKLWKGQGSYWLDMGGSVELMPSSDGISWDPDPHGNEPTYNYYSPVVFEDYLFAGRNRYCHSGPDGWHDTHFLDPDYPVTSAPYRSGSTKVVFKGKLWWIGGTTNDVWNWGD